MLELKKGVDFSKLTPELVHGIWIAEEVFASFGLACVVTSCRDGKHGPNSLHNRGEIGRAADLRSWTVPRTIVNEVLEALRKRLVPLGFDVILEKLNVPGEHFHIEHDPKE